MYICMCNIWSYSLKLVRYLFDSHNVYLIRILRDNYFEEIKEIARAFGLFVWKHSD